MKILVVCQYYYPEPVRITDICEELVKRGHEVTVLTGVPNYPMGIIYKGYRHGKEETSLSMGFMWYDVLLLAEDMGLFQSIKLF